MMFLALFPKLYFSCHIFLHDDRPDTKMEPVLILDHRISCNKNNTMSVLWARCQKWQKLNWQRPWETLSRLAAAAWDFPVMTSSFSPALLHLLCWLTFQLKQGAQADDRKVRESSQLHSQGALFGEIAGGESFGWVKQYQMNSETGWMSLNKWATQLN